MRCLDFCNDKENCEFSDRLRKIRPVLNVFQKTFTGCLNPYQKLVIDESLVRFKGRLIFKQFIPSKRHHFGMKLFILCDCETGVILDFAVYTGTDIDIDTSDPLGISVAVGKKLLHPYLNKGHIYR